MKRLYTLLLATLVALLAACGSGDEPAVPAPTAAAPAVPTAEAAPATLPPPVVSAPDAGAPSVSDPAPEAAPLWPADRFGYGIQIHGDATYGNQPEVANAIANQLGLSWVKMQIRWDQVHPSPDAEQWFFYDATLEDMDRAGLYIMVSVLDAPDWARSVFGTEGQEGPPDDYGLYVTFLNELLQRHGDKIDAIEIWNEQNLDREWTSANGVNAVDYVELLRQSYAAVKAYNPEIIVISGALSPTGVNIPFRVQDDFVYLDEAIAAGMLNYADCVGAHHNGINLPPDVPFDQTGSLPEAATATFRGPFDNPDHSWSFYTTLTTYAQKVQAARPEMKLCVTEFGWASAVDYGEAVAGFGFALDNTVEEQADYIVRAFQQMRDSGTVWLAFLFNYDYGNKVDPTSDTVAYSIIDRSGVPRPAFGAIADMPK